MEVGTKVTVCCPTFKRGRKLSGTITGEKLLSPLHIAKYGRTYYVVIDGNKKATTLHESWLKQN